MPEIFREAKLKIQRAVKHINDLNSILSEFSKRQTHEVIVEHDPHGGDDVLRVRAIETLPDSFSLTLGDALHNLRTSLDYAIGEIEFSTLHSRGEYTKFPVDESRQALVSRIQGGLEKRAPKEVIDCIVNSIQPYKGGNGEFILSLHELDIEDKHRLLIAKMEYKYVSGIVLVDEEGEEFSIPTWQVVNDRIADCRIPGTRNSKVKEQGQASFEVLFGDSVPFAGNTIVPLLRRLTHAITITLNDLEHWFRMSQI